MVFMTFFDDRSSVPVLKPGAVNPVCKRAADL